MDFHPYPFEKLNSLLRDIEPPSAPKPLLLTIGEPQFATPQFIQDELIRTASLLNKYPKIAGDAALTDAQRGYVARRFGVELDEGQLVTTLGTREALFNLPQFLLFDKQESVMAYPNPFYQIYEGSAIASRARSVHLPLAPSNGFKPLIDEARLARCDLVILNSPSNPTASVMSLDELTEWARLAIKHDFVLINDECYSDIYTRTPPHSLLEAALHIGNDSFKNILVLNSISKRSCAPSLRSGFVAGDAKLLAGYAKYRTYAGCAAPLPAQLAAAAAWGDDAHVEASRVKYLRNFELAREILGLPIPEATFYVWLKVGDDEAFARDLWREMGVKVLPGSYLGREGEGRGYVRLALVLEEDEARDALTRIAKFIDKNEDLN
jgi:aspartate/methionine/tyrosine aminotransferase